MSNEYKKEVNVKIGGLGVGGCDVVLQPGEANPTDCWCLWGTLHYTFCAYTKVGAVEKETPIVNNTTSLATADGRCPLITGITLNVIPQRSLYSQSNFLHRSVQVNHCCVPTYLRSVAATIVAHMLAPSIPVVCAIALPCNGVQDTISKLL